MIIVVFGLFDWIVSNVFVVFCLGLFSFALFNIIISEVKRQQLMNSLTRVSRYLMSQNHYSVLGISEDSNSTLVRNSYLQKIKTYHPDTEGGDHQKFIAVQKAFEVLSDQTKRRIYDKSIGIENSIWESDLMQSTNETFENEQIENILSQKGSMKKKKRLDAYETLLERYQVEREKPENQKYHFGNMAIWLSFFGAFWIIWQTAETFFLNYKGDSKYESKVSTEGKDFSIFANQIR